MIASAAVDDPVNILLVDDQPAKLLSYEAILEQLGERLIKTLSAKEALEQLLRNDVAVVLMDVCMPETDGFELAEMIQDHPRFQKTAIIFVSAINVTDLDRLRGYQAGAVDYVPVPVVPEVLRAKVRVFAELYRKTRQLERLNDELERRVGERTAALEAVAARLQESEQRRTQALAAARMGSWDWDPVAEEIIWDRGQYAIFGVTPASFTPTRAGIYRRIHPEDLERLRNADEQAAERNEPYEIEFRVVRPDGDIRWCVASGAPSVDSDGRKWLSGVALDVTEQKRSQLALRKLNEELEHRIEERTREREHALAQLFEAQKLDTIGHLTGGVAHDFNNLLMAVLGSLELLRKRLPEDPKSLRLLDNAVQGAQRGEALTQRLLAFARRQELRPEAVDLARLVDGMVPLLERALGINVVLAIDIPADLPRVSVDTNQLELALLNLAVNASDAMPVGGILRISAVEDVLAKEDEACPPSHDYVRISVTDTGAGMDEATLARASEPFFTTKGPGKGTGLGLSMVHGLAAQSGGGMKLSSQVGKGTIVELWLPRATQLLEALPSANGELHSPHPVSEAYTVLLVDDDPLVCTGTAAMLEDLGHIVIEASSGRRALDILAANPRIDLVITDHAMPEMTGFELAARIDEIYPGMKVILASGFAELPEPAGAGVPRLSKPFRQDELAAAIRELALGTLSKVA